MKEKMLLNKIFGYLVIRFKAQDVEKEAVLSAIGEYLYKNKVSPMPLVKGVLNTLVDYEEYKIVEKNGIITFVSYDETEEKGGETVKKTYECRLSIGEKKIAKSLYSKWNKRGISSGHKDNLCKIGGCKERVLKVLKIRGYLEQKGDYYRIISEKFEEL